MSKFKKGDKVMLNPQSKYAGTGEWNPLNVNGVVTKTVESNIANLCVCVEWSNGTNNSYRYEDLQSIEENNVKQFTKFDLKTGMRVKLREGKLDIIFIDTNDGGIVTDGKTWTPLRNYSEDLIANFGNGDYDIVEVYSQPTVPTELGNVNVKGSLLWKREGKSQAQIDLEKLQQQIKELSEQAKVLEQSIKN